MEAQGDGGLASGGGADAAAAGAAKRPRRGEGRRAELPVAAVRRRYFTGVQHGGLDIAELEWRPGDAETEWLARWRSAAQLARASMPVIVTYVLLAKGWEPWTVAMESALIPAQWGLWAARPLVGGDIIAWMLDGTLCGLFASDSDPALAAARVRQGGGELYLLAQYGGVVLRDGRGSRRGGPRCMNDARGRRARQNALLRDDGALVVLPFTEVQPMSASMSTAEMKASELTYSYDGPCVGSYWGDEREEE